MPILEAIDIWKSFGGRSVLKGVSLGLEAGQVCSVVGPSGGGKSTLLKCLNLLHLIDRGEVWFGGRVAARATAEAVTVPEDPCTLRRQVGLVFQEWNLWPNRTVRENIAMAPRRVLRMTRQSAQELAERCAEEVGITDKLDAYPHALSGGQKQRAAIARALAMQPSVLMFDEVTSALDPSLAAEVLDVMMVLRGEGRTLLVVTHHIGFARAVSDRVAFLYDGRIHEFGNASILDEPGTPELGEFLRQVRRVG